MPEAILFSIILIFFLIIELFYFKVALRYRIIDLPNERSSHLDITLRGGGIIFPLAGVTWSMYSGQYYWFAAGLLAVSFVSFIDDLNHVPNLLRSGVHLASVVLLLFQVSPLLPFYWYPVVTILIIGTINSWNFMDGINGITGAYSLITIGSLYYIQQYTHSFTEGYLLLVVMAALLVFNYFNFRKKAKCFAGDVGSVSIAFICCFLMAQLIGATGNFLFLALFLVYGLDVASTILFRLMRKENIFEAHRSHFYQYLANEKGWPHLAVAALYAGIQLVINFAVIQYPGAPDSGFNIIPLLLLCIASAAVFMLIRWKVEGKERLLGKK